MYLPSPRSCVLGSDALSPRNQSESVDMKIVPRRSRTSATGGLNSAAVIASDPT